MVYALCGGDDGKALNVALKQPLAYAAVILVLYGAGERAHALYGGGGVDGGGGDEPGQVVLVPVLLGREAKAPYRQLHRAAKILRLRAHEDDPAVVRWVERAVIVP